MPMNAEYRGPIDLPEVIPVFPLAGCLLLPRGQLPLNIFEPRYLAMIDDALRDSHRLIGMIQPDSAHAGTSRNPPLYKIGCVGRITQLAESGDGRYVLELTGVSATVDKPGRATANFLDQQVDKKVIDGTVNGIGKLFIVAGNGLRHIQDGYIRRYALGITVGIASLLLFILAYAVR